MRGKIIEFKYNRKKKYGYILYDYGEWYHVKGFKPYTEYKVLKKDIIGG